MRPKMVDFPAPLWPMRVILVPRRIEKSTAWRMGFLTPKSKETFSNRTITSPRCIVPAYHALYNSPNLFLLKMLVVSFGLRFCLVDDAVAVVGRRVERVEFHRVCCRSVDDIVVGAARDNHYRAVREHVLLAVEHRLALPLFHPNKLVELVHLRAAILSGQQRHNHQLEVLVSVQHPAEVPVFERVLFDIGDIAFHSYLSFPSSNSHGRAILPTLPSVMARS